MAAEEEKDCERAKILGGKRLWFGWGDEKDEIFTEGGAVLVVGTCAALRSSRSCLIAIEVEFGSSQMNGPCGHSESTQGLICTGSCGGRTFDKWNIAGVENGNCSVGLSGLVDGIYGIAHPQRVAVMSCVTEDPERGFAGKR